MQNINQDNLFSILEFLDIKTLIKLSKTNKFINKEIKNNKKLLLKSKISKVWGTNICDIIPANKIDKVIKYNRKNFFIILELFYNGILNNNFETSSHLLIEIYHHIYIFINLNDSNREKFFKHRTNIIKKISNNKQIKNNKKISYILNATGYLNRFCYFLNGNSFDFTHDKIIDIINNQES